MKQNKFIPELRFPGFEGFWEEKPIEGIGNTLNGLAGKSSSDFGEGSPYVTYKQVFDKSVIDFEACEKVIINADEKQNTLQKGDILFTTSSETPYEVGFSSVLIDSPKEDTYLNSFCFAIRPFDFEIINAEFARYLFHSSNYRNAVTAIAQGSTRYNLSKSAFLRLTVSLPSFLEQQKIAYCLSSLDAVIDEHSKRLELLQEHKKGLLQQLFPQEGEKLPRLRFPEFERDGEWTIKTLKELTEKIGDGIHTTPKYDILGDFYFINGNNLIDGKIIVDEKTKKISYKEFEIHKKDLTNDTILISINGTIGNLAFYHNEKIVLGKSACYITPKNTLNSKFLYYYLDTPIIKTYFSTELTGSTIKNLSLKSIRDALIKHPNLFEQKKIADCLSSLDNLIEAEERRIEQLQLHKKGLMQKLFPVMND